MDIQQLYEICLQKKGVTEHFPFDQDTLVFKVMGKVFALTSLLGWEQGNPSINLKCNPEWAEELRITYDSVNPGYHMSKKYWNTIKLSNGEISNEFLLKLLITPMMRLLKDLVKNYNKN